LFFLLVYACWDNTKVACPVAALPQLKDSPGHTPQQKSQVSFVPQIIIMVLGITNHALGGEHHALEIESTMRFQIFLTLQFSIIER
jgi:hypothetical protein